MSIESRLSTFCRQPIIGIFLILLSSTYGARSQVAPEDKNLCYAFLSDGELRSACEGKQESIHFRTRLLDFAVSRDGSHAAFELEYPGNKYIVRIVSLEKGLLIGDKVGERLILKSTCGEIVGVDPVTDERWNLLNRDVDRISAYDYFLCSADRQVVAGWIASDRSNGRSPDNPFGSLPLHVRRHGEDTQWRIEEPLDFDVSQNGLYIGYFSRVGSRPELCVRNITFERCVAAQGGAIVVADSGDVLFTSEQGLSYWHIGAKAPVILSKSGNIQSPQWITPAVAHALRGRAAKNAAPVKQR